MKNRTLWWRLSFLLVAALVIFGLPLYASGKKEVKQERAATGEPQYGGKLTVIHRTETNEGIPDPANGQYPMVYWLNHVCDRILTGGLAEYGPRGTNEWGWDVAGWPPPKLLVGSLAERWEVFADRIVFHIRPGVQWSGMSINKVMEPREYTADDFVFNFNRSLEGTTSPGVKAMDWVESVSAEDKYTAVIKTKFFHAEWWMHVTFVIWGQQIPPETVEAGPRDWKNIVGTGPFAIKEYTPGAYITYEPNPLYWRKTTINGKEYKIPFVDELTYPVMPDEATAVAALRTAQIDAYLYADWVHEESLAKTTPELQKQPILMPGVWGFQLRVDKPPFDNKEVRRALFLGTDREGIAKTVCGLPNPTLDWPLVAGAEGYVPYERLPASAQELVKYDPVKAKQMLADAGYPDGFKARLLTGTRPLGPEVAEMLAGEWKRTFNIDLELEVVDLGIQGRTARDNPDRWDIWLNWWGNSPGLSRLESLGSSKGGGNYSHYSNPSYDERIKKAAATVDNDERAAMLEELFIELREEVVAIPISWMNVYLYWWPWVKNYEGEYYYFIHDPPYDLMWIDQNLKKEMGH